MRRFFNFSLFPLCFLLLPFWGFFFYFIKFSLILFWHVSRWIIWVESLINSRTITSWLLRIYLWSIVFDEFFFSLLSCLFFLSISLNPWNCQPVFNRYRIVSARVKSLRILIELCIVIDLRTLEHFSRLLFFF